MELTWLLLLFSSFFFSITTAQDDEVCSRPELGESIKLEGLQRYFSFGAVVVLACKPGYTPVQGPRTIVCKDTGTWTDTKLKCIPVQCSYPDPPHNGQLHYENTQYNSTVNYTCDEGYFLTGASSAVCLVDGTWSAPEPQCKPISCGPAPIPQFGMIIYDKIIKVNNINYGTSGTYKCHPPFALFGKERAECTATGQWTETPQCKEVSCPPPENIENGFMSISQKRDFAYTETIKYGCNDDYVLDGPHIVCEKNGEWSQKPSCKAPCSIGIKRGRILYKGRKLWIEDLKPNQVLHGETVSVYCMGGDSNCGYEVLTQCLDGNLQIPECFDEPSAAQYSLDSGSLPSEIQQC
uniref:Beta-2-glycoprotein 1 n=1 Tax=Neogobius melanostomus TaxID=47308 RepID=A0A8C6U0U5_9GOBI